MNARWVTTAAVVTLVALLTGGVAFAVTHRGPTPGSPEAFSQALDPLSNAIKNKHSYRQASQRYVDVVLDGGDQNYDAETTVFIGAVSEAYDKYVISQKQAIDDLWFMSKQIERLCVTCTVRLQKVAYNYSGEKW